MTMSRYDSLDNCHVEKIYLKNWLVNMIWVQIFFRQDKRITDVTAVSNSLPKLCLSQKFLYTAILNDKTFAASSQDQP